MPSVNILPGAQLNRAAQLMAWVVSVLGHGTWLIVAARHEQAELMWPGRRRDRTPRGLIASSVLRLSLLCAGVHLGASVP
jgi:hypothetical protein